MRENLILNNTSILEDIDGFDSDTGDFGHHDSAEGVRDGGIDVDEIELGMVLIVLIEVDTTGVTKLVNVPAVIFSRVVAGKVGGCNISNDFSLDSNDLELGERVRAAVSTRRRTFRLDWVAEGMVMVL